MEPAYNLLCTVGTSLLTNLSNLAKQALNVAQQSFIESYKRKDWRSLAYDLKKISSEDRLCGAEINSIHSLVKKGYIHDNFKAFFLHSDTDDGRSVATILKNYYETSEKRVELIEVKDLNDRDPHKFRTKGLRNLVKELCKVIRDHYPTSCAINATGGYKAQIAIAVMLGQAIDVPVYYMFESFPEIISFPPVPVSLDFNYWLNRNETLYKLADTDMLECVVEDVSKEGDENIWKVCQKRTESHFQSKEVIVLDAKLKSLVEVEEIDGKKYVALTPAGQIFHETLSEKFKRDLKNLLLPADKKNEPKLEKSGHIMRHPEIINYLKRLTHDNEFVKQCKTTYYNPDLPCCNTFYKNNYGEIEGTYSEGNFCVKFIVDTTARNDAEKEIAIAALNKWLYER